MKDFERIKDRYEKHYVRDDQLDRYVALGVITQAQAEEIRGADAPQPPAGDYVVTQAEIDAAYREGVNEYE